MAKFSEKFRLFFLASPENGFQPHSLRTQAIIFYIVLAFFIKILSLSSVAVLPKTSFFADITSRLIVSSTNEARKENGLSALQVNPILQQAAYEKALDMISKKYFSHDSPDGTTPWFWFYKNGYDFRYAGENLAIDFFESNDVVRAWLNSESHRENILNKNYQEIGVAVASVNVEGRNTTLVVQLFGTPKAKPPLAATKPSPLPVSPLPEASPEEISPPLPEASPVVIAEEGPAGKDIFAGIKETQSEIAGSALGFLAQPRWLYLGFIGYLVLALIFGISSKAFVLRPQAVAAAIFAILVVGSMLILPDAEALLGLQARVLP